MKSITKKSSSKKASTNLFSKRRRIKRGNIANGVMIIIALIAVLSFALVFGLQKFSDYETTQSSNYLCCDSGDGELCTPNAAVNLRVRVKGVDTIYQLLKTGIKFQEGYRHLEPVLQPGYISPELPEGQYVYLNIVSENPDAQLEYVRPLGGPNMCASRASNEERENPMDTIFGPNLKGGCEAIPDDELVYVCTKGCEADPTNGEKGIFDVYFRVNDLTHPGIPDAIRYCAKPDETIATGSGQRIINLPSPSAQPDLQLETFYIEQDSIVANWVSPYCKPAIYLYPEIILPVNVKVEPVGQMLITIPEYPANGWNVIAYPSGDIYSALKRYDYLFYEAAIPDDVVVLPDEGFVVDYESLDRFIPDLVTRLGLAGKEKDQFSEYWLKVLPESPYYQIKVVEQTVLDKISPLYITPNPKTTIRITLHFTPVEERLNLNEPEIRTPQREGFTVVEWGGIFKRDANHSFSCFM